MLPYKELKLEFTKAVCTENEEKLQTILDNNNFNSVFLNWFMSHDALFVSVKHNNKIVKLLFRKGYRANKSHNYEFSLFPFAVQNNDTECVQLLLQLGLSVNSRLAFNKTPLHIAILNKQEEMVRFLLDHGANVNAKNYLKEAPTMSAVKVGNLGILQELLKRNVPVNSTNFIVRKRKKTLPVVRSKTSPLLPIAVKTGNKQVIKLLLENGACSNSKVGRIHTVLYYAVKNRNIDVISLLLDHKPSINDKGNKLALSYAIRNYEQPDELQVIDELLDYGLIVDFSEKRYQETFTKCVSRGYTLLVEDYLVNSPKTLRYLLLGSNEIVEIAVQNQDAEMVKLLLKFGARARYCVNEAIDEHNVEIVQVLLEQCKRKDEKSVISHAFLSGEVNVIKSVVDWFLYATTNRWASPLHIASYEGHRDIVESLLQEGAVVNNDVDVDLITPLQLAIFGRHNDVVLQLINSGAHINVSKGYFFNVVPPLHIATMVNAPDIVELLLQRGACVNSIDEEMRTPLYLATSKSHKEIVELLLAYDTKITEMFVADALPVNVAIERGNVDIFRLYMHYAVILKPFLHRFMYKAIKWNHKELILYLLEFRDDETTGLNDRLCEFLMNAVEADNVDVVTVLLNMGADMYSGDNELNMPYYRALRMGHKNIVEVFLQKGASVNIRHEDMISPLWTTAWAGRTDIVELLLEKGADIDVRNKYHEETDNRFCHHEKQFQTPLLIACKKNHCDIVELLLQRGAEVKLDDSRDLRSAVHIAVTQKAYAIVAKLLERVEINNETKRLLREPMSIAINNRHCEIVKHFLDIGFDVNDVIGNNMSTSLHQATECSDYVTVSLLLVRGADVNAKMKKSRSPLHIAVRNKFLKLAKLLLMYGADVDARDFQNATPLFSASFYGFTKIVHCLIEHGADVNVVNSHGETALTHVASYVEPGRDAYYMDNVFNDDYELDDDLYHEFETMGRQKGCKDAMKIMKRLILNLKKKNLYVHPHNLSFITPAFERFCAKGMRRMKKEKLFGNVTTFDVFTKDTNHVAIYVTNENILNIKYHRYPYYSSILKLCVSKAMEKRMALDAADTCLEMLFGFHFPHTVKKEIFFYLDNDDLYALAEVFNTANSSVYSKNS